MCLPPAQNRMFSLQQHQRPRTDLHHKRQVHFSGDQLPLQLPDTHMKTHTATHTMSLVTGTCDVKKKVTKRENPPPFSHPFKVFLTLNNIEKSKCLCSPRCLLVHRAGVAKLFRGLINHIASSVRALTHDCSERFFFCIAG